MANSVQHGPRRDHASKCVFVRWHGESLFQGSRSFEGLGIVSVPWTPMPDVICDPPASRVGRRSFLLWPSPAVQHLADSLLQSACVADGQAVWGDPKLLCDLIHRISLQSPLADLPR